MSIRDKLSPISVNHPDAATLTQFSSLVEGLWMYSEDKQPYDVFIWDVATHGELLVDPPYSFSYRKIVEKIYGKMTPIGKTNLLQEKHRSFFEFDGEKLANKKPLKFYRDQYRVWNQFVGRIYTDNGALNQDEITKMRALAKQLWMLESNTVRIFEFGLPIIQQYLFGRTENGNWLGIHTVSVET
ncbi:nuclease A inhibitor family protein [Zooshikella sp. RANM57]|uniref:nuclease A inhibitor family protein n=1 Tax=Zooshikella sp. RANM57 TaxID=3425863 RepID=UPI003D6F47F1